MTRYRWTAAMLAALAALAAGPAVTPAGEEGGETMEIKVEKNPGEERLAELGVFEWAIWEKEESEFPWHYSATEICYILEGAVTVTPKGGEPVEIGPGDLVTFPRGMDCTWHITRAIRKHYIFR